MQLNKTSIFCAVIACFSLLPPIVYADEVSGVIDKAGLDLSSQENWMATNSTILYGDNDQSSSALFGFMMTDGSSTINMEEGTTLRFSQQPNTDYGLGFYMIGSQLNIDGSLAVQGDNPTLFIAAIEDSELSIKGNFEINASSSAYPMHGLMINGSTVALNNIDFMAEGAPTAEGVPGLPHSGITFFNTSDSTVTINSGTLKIGKNNVGDAVGFRSDYSTINLNNVFFDLNNESGGVTAIAASDSKIEAGKGDVTISGVGQIKFVNATGGSFRKDGGKIKLESKESDVSVIEASAAEINNLQIEVISGENALGFQLDGINSINNTSLTMRSGKNSTGASITGYGPESDNYLKIDNFFLNIAESREQAIGLELNRNADIYNSEILVNSDKTAIGIVAPQGNITIDSVKVVAAGEEDSYGIMRTGTTNFGTPVRGNLTFRGENYIEAANALGAGRGNNRPMEGHSERDFTLTVEDGKTVFNGKIGEFKGTFNAKGGTTVFTDTTLNGAFNIGEASVIFGEQDSQKLESLKSENNLSTPLLYVAQPLYLLNGASLKNGVHAQTDPKQSGVILSSGSTTVINGDIGENYVFNSTDPDMVFKIEPEALILADNIVAGKDLRVANFATEIEGKDNSVIKPISRLVELEIKATDDNQLILTVRPSNNISPVEPGDELSLRSSPTLIPTILEAVAFGAMGQGADRLWYLSDRRNGLSDREFVRAVNSIALMGTASGIHSVALNSANNQLDVIDSHGSLLTHINHKEKGFDLWIGLNGYFSRADKYSVGSIDYGYKSSLGGVTVGSDYSFGNEHNAGIAVAFGKGSVRGQGSGSGIKNDIDYYGLNLYEIWSGRYVNTISSLGYLQTKNTIKLQGYKGKPDVKIFSAGVRFEKPLAVNNCFTITPHVGIRYKHVKTDGFDAGGFSYESENANLVELPFGVAFNGEAKGPFNTQVKPFVDLTISPNLGDRKITQKVSLDGAAVKDSFDARIANSTIYKAKIGLSAGKDNHSFAINYAIGGGENGRLDQSLQAKYIFRF